MKTEAKADYEIAAEKAQALFDTLKIQTAISQPLPDVKDEWPNILYHVTFSRNGHNVSVEYRLGVGHVKWPKKYEDIPRGTSNNMIPVFNTVRQNPGAQLKNKFEHAQAAAWLAVNQKVAPKPFEVMAAICDDGFSAHSDSFENYAGNYGMDSDSIKARRIYDYYAELYHKLANLIGSNNVAELAQLHAEF